MNAGQEKFFTFMLERAQDRKQEEVKNLLMESFSRQQTTPLTKETFLALKTQLLELIREEAVQEVSGAMEHFGGNLK